MPNKTDKICDELRSGHLPLAMAMEWEQNGQEIWDHCKDARSLIRLLEHIDRKSAAIAAVACARTSLRYASEYESELKRIIETVESWMRGTADVVECQRAANVAWQIYCHPTIDLACAHAAGSVCCVARHDFSSSPSEAAASASVASRNPDLFWDTLRDLANIVRGLTACPSVQQLILAAESRAE